MGDSRNRSSCSWLWRDLFSFVPIVKWQNTQKKSLHFLAVSWNQKRISTSYNDLQENSLSSSNDEDQIHDGNKWSWLIQIVFAFDSPDLQQSEKQSNNEIVVRLLSLILRSIQEERWSSTMIDSSIEKSFVVDFQLKSRFNRLQCTLTTSNEQSEKWKCQSTTTSSFSLQFEEKIDFIHLARRSEQTNWRILFFSQKIWRSTKVSFARPVLSLFYSLGKISFESFFAHQMDWHGQATIRFLSSIILMLKIIIGRLARGDSLQIISTTNASRWERREEKVSLKMIQLNHSNQSESRSIENFIFKRSFFNESRLIDWSYLFLRWMMNFFFKPSVDHFRSKRIQFDANGRSFFHIDHLSSQQIFFFESIYRHVRLFARITRGDSKDSNSRESYSE